MSYVWIDGSGKTMREKTMTVDKEPTSHEDLPWWSYDGSSTYQVGVKPLRPRLGFVVHEVSAVKLCHLAKCSRIVFV